MIVTGTLLDRPAYLYETVRTLSEDTVLAFLQSLCSALLSRNVEALRDLLEHPLAAALPEQVVGEAQRIISGEAQPFSAPLNALQLYHQTAHLLGVCVDPGSRPEPTQRRSLSHDAPQIELPLPARVA